VSVENTESSTLRTGVIGVAAVATIGLAAELLVERHWGSAIRLIPWAALGALGWAIWRLWRGPSVREIRLARAIAVLSLAAASAGIVLHIIENYKAGPLDQRYALLWDAMSEAERWWAAFSRSLGPAPTFAPAALALVALLVLVATQRHPVLAQT
jgi:hypothetical protein